MNSARSFAIIVIVHLAVIVLWQLLVDAFHVPKFVLRSAWRNTPGFPILPSPRLKYLAASASAPWSA